MVNTTTRDPSSPRPTVLVTGITGPVGTAIALDLARAGFALRGSSRSEIRASEWSRKYPELGVDWEIIKDHEVSETDTYSKAVRGCSAVIHVAGPYTLTHLKGEDIMIRQVQGVKSILNACSNEASVQRLVYTSTVAAINDDPHLGTGLGKTYTEEDWNPATWEKGACTTGDHMAVTSYCAGKTVAEKAAWDFMSDRQPHFDLVTICPGTIYGEPMQVLNSLKDLDAAHARLWSHITHALQVVPKDPSPVFSNILDVAEAHLKALTWPKCGGNRYMVVSGYYSYARVFSILRERFPEQADRFPIIPNNGLPVSPSFWNNCSKAEKELGMRWRTLEETVSTAAEVLFKLEKQSSETPSTE
ncbi:hypothetical protein G7Z17_g509 [Cylindrodendrum hubeiense]|uniref:3-beta hydroxysteroid dehydrogenase/isomerase domain-containing protein n=1 Tax=Cylindrodendrum hubeiense TaxID=595255 RepID=A0A9P5LM92_9HYPO|nr:hypothetical protein G7Z17_g509 [Cylindrodendrum hubeiense]